MSIVTSKNNFLQQIRELISEVYIEGLHERFFFPLKESFSNNFLKIFINQKMTVGECDQSKCLDLPVF